MADYSSRNIGFVVDSAPVAAPVMPAALPPAAVPLGAFLDMAGYAAMLERDLIARAMNDAGNAFYLN